MFRSDFLAGLISSGAALFSSGDGTSAASPASTSTINPFERCDKNYVLPYDQPIEFKQRALDAPDVDLTAYRGNVVLLNFFETWCGPCNAEQPDLVEAANSYYAQGLRVVGVNVDESDDTVRKYRDKYKIVYPIAMDGKGLLARVENNDVVSTISFPITLFVSETGLLTCYRKGAMRKGEMVYKIERMLSFLHGGS